MTVVRAPPAPVETVTVAAAASTALTSPPVPRFCQSSRSFSCFCAMSAPLIATNNVASNDLPSALAEPRAITRSPACKSARLNGLAPARVFCPGSIRSSRAFSSTVTCIVAPASFLTEIEFPLRVWTVPKNVIGFAAAASCAVALIGARLAAANTAPQRIILTAGIVRLVSFVRLLRPVLLGPLLRFAHAADLHSRRPQQCCVWLAGLYPDGLQPSLRRGDEGQLVLVL